MNTVQFKDIKLSNELEVEGSVIFPFLTAIQIDALKELFNKFHTENPQGFYATTHAEDKDWRKQVSNEILAIIKDSIDPLFDSIDVLGGAFISKAPGEKGILPLHQDWNIVDEKVARSYNLWVPLVDVNEFNGAMRILGRSHQKQETYRGPNLPPTLYKISDAVDQHMVSLNMKAGMGLLYDHALWHSSPINQSNELRLAIVFGVIPKGASMRFYHQNDKELEEYVSHSEFFFQNDPKDGPKGLELNKSFPFENEILNEEQFNQVYLGVEPKKKSSGFFGLFKRTK
ncbi:MAG: phytanoyl-CoA dioxygenase family protein [Crocinitomicaceae bacterium]|nr:phytanoyl-CoA dioxygenase family protein [Crocinitomicaceae bacterium]